jgi:hypothetical protein
MPNDDKPKTGIQVVLREGVWPCNKCHYDALKTEDRFVCVGCQWLPRNDNWKEKAI